MSNGNVAPWSTLVEPTREKLEQEALSEVVVDPGVYRLWQNYLKILGDKGAGELAVIREHIGRRRQECFSAIESMGWSIEAFRDDPPVEGMIEAMQQSKNELWTRLAVFNQRQRILERLLDLYSLDGLIPDLTPAGVARTLLDDIRVMLPKLFVDLARGGFGRPDNKRFVWHKRAVREVVYLCKCLTNAHVLQITSPSLAASFISQHFCWSGGDFSADSIKSTWGEIKDDHSSRLRQPTRRKRYEMLSAIAMELNKSLPNNINP